MECFASYLEKLKLFNSLFNQTLSCDNAHPTKTSDKFIFQLVLELCDDISLQQSVLAKLKYFTSFTKCYLSGVQLKPKYFDNIIKTYRAFIVNNLCKYFKENSEVISEGFIVDFYFRNAIKEWEPSDISASNIKLSLGVVENISEAGSLYNYEDIFMKSIVGANTVEKYGIDGFLALLIIFIDEKYLLETKKIEPLYILCSKLLAEKFNKMYSTRIYDVNIKNNYDSHRLVLELQLKKKIKDWIDLIQSIINLPEEIIQDCAMYFSENIQKVFFKRIIQSDNCTIITYQKNYDDVIDASIIGENIRNMYLSKVISYIKEIYKIITMSQWLDFLISIFKLNEVDILIIFFHIDPIFRNVFFGLQNNFCNKEISFLHIESIKHLCLIKDKYYEKNMTIYCPNQTSEYKLVKWTYDENLKQTGHRIKKYVNKIRIETKIFSVNGKKI